MKLGLDLHGVISDLSGVMKFLGESVVKNQGEVHVITGSFKKKALEELEELGFEKDKHYTHLFCIGDYLYESGARIKSINRKFGNIEFNDNEWDRVKGDYCRKNHIDLHIDDSLIYNEYFETPFARLWTHTQTPKINKPKRHLE